MKFKNVLEQNNIKNYGILNKFIKNFPKGILKCTFKDRKTEGWYTKHSHQKTCTLELRMHFSSQ
jgi:hypothetical protein